MQPHLAYPAPQQRCLYCGAEEPDTDDTCAKTGGRHTLVSFGDKEGLGQGYGEGPGDTDTGWDPNTLGYGSSVGEPDTDDQETLERSLSQRVKRQDHSTTKVKTGSLHTADGTMMMGANMAGPSEDEGPALDPEPNGPVGVEPIPAPPPPPATVRYCAFCGSAGISGRSDGSIECSYCQSVFSVEQRDQFPFAPGPAPSPATAETPFDQDAADDEEDDDDLGGDNSDGDDGNPFGDDESHDEGHDAIDDGSEVDGEDDDIPPQLRRRSYLTAQGRLSLDNYLRHVALRVSDNPAITLKEMQRL